MYVMYIRRVYGRAFSRSSSQSGGFKQNIFIKRITASKALRDKITECFFVLFISIRRFYDWN